MEKLFLNLLKNVTITILVLSIFTMYIFTSTCIEKTNKYPPKNSAFV